MSIHLSTCLRVVLVQFVVNGMGCLSLRLICIIVGPLWSKSAVQDKVLQWGAIPEALVVKVCCAWQSPPMRGNFWSLSGQSPLCKTKSSNEGQFLEALCGWSLLHETKSSDKGQFLKPFVAFVVKVRCACQSPPMRGSSWGPRGQSPLCKTKFSNKGQILETLAVKVCYARQSPPTRGSFLRPSMVKVCCARQSPPARGSSWRHLWSKSAVHDKVLQWGAVPEALVVKVRYARQSPPMKGRSLRPSQSKYVVHDKLLRRGANYEAYLGQVRYTWQRPPLRGRHQDIMSKLPQLK